MTLLVKRRSPQLTELNNNSDLVEYESLWLANFDSQATRRTYKRHIDEFNRCFDIRTPEDFRSVDMGNIILYRDWLKSTNKSNRTIRNKLSALSSCFDFLISKQVISINPATGVKRPKVDETSGETPVMTPEQVKLMLQQPDRNTLQGSRDYAILCYLFFTGARIGSPRSIKIKDLYEDKGFYVLKFVKKGDTKQVIPVHPELRAALVDYLDKSSHKNNPNAPLFHAVRVDKNQGNEMSNQSFVKIWNKYRIKADLPAQFSPHSSRATFATTAEELGVPLQDIQTALGHANISTTQAYVHSKKQHKDSAVFSVKY